MDIDITISLSKRQCRLLADIGNALMAFPNIIGIILLSPVLFKIVREEVKKDPRFVL